MTNQRLHKIFEAKSLKAYVYDPYPEPKHLCQIKKSNNLLEVMEET